MQYFFHVDSDDGIVEDFEGQEFANLEIARDAAVSVVRAMILEALQANTGMDIAQGKVTIADDSGVVLDEISFLEALRTVDKFYGSGKVLP